MAPTSRSCLCRPTGSPDWNTIHTWSVTDDRNVMDEITDLYTETPRYLCWTGRHELALQVIQRLHRDTSNPEDTAAEAEYVQIRAQVEKDKEETSGYIRMFTKPSWRKRSLLVLLIM